MFEISVDYSFAAGHALRGYKGKCENVHGHNYKVRVTVAGEELNSIGLLMDFVDLRGAIKALAERLDHRFMNDLEPFDKLNPSAENLARYFCDELGSRVKDQGLRVQAVTVWETDTTSATFRPSQSS
ncbi:MAG: 6-carboxytetrahydropterin synthase QueD [Acidobacteria bacterium]|nr:6-carboxytetrahydropterin synthase QueD [Acidobacteriota bacterium]